MDLITNNTSDLKKVKESLLLALQIINKSLHEEKAAGVSTPAPRKGKGRPSPNQAGIDKIIERRRNRFK